ncbi:hypothetical protein [Treponema sp.]|uniref:TP0733 family outer membrane beta-barrel protein n=1 Tax=Treponema sp. TaxID=166 RepID=UPI0025F6EBAF|nr:hypothetical protein [Treponema sp.]MCR5218056.1 hypothetical protein [Treponema sp.]
MKRLATIAGLLAACTLTAFAQVQEDDSIYFEPETIVNESGAQNIRLALGLSFPLNFPDIPSLFESDGTQLNIGGMGNLGYHRFIAKDIALGFDISFGFNATIGEHILSYTPILFSATWQPTWKKLEFPISLNVGFAWESYNNDNYFPGLVIKPEAGVHYRFNQDWSAGIEFSYLFMPQFCELYGTGKNYYGQFATISAVARYYF